MKVCKPRVLALGLLFLISFHCSSVLYAQEMKSLANNVLLKQGQSLYNDQKYTQSYAVFLQAYRWNNSSKADKVVALKYMSFIHIIMKRYAQARSTIFKLLTLNPGFKLDSAWDPPKFVRYFALVRKEFTENSKARVFDKTPSEWPAKKDLKLRFQVRDIQKRVKQLVVWFRITGQNSYSRRLLKQQTQKEWQKTASLWWTQQPVVASISQPVGRVLAQDTTGGKTDTTKPAARQADTKKPAAKDDAKKPDARTTSDKATAAKKTPAKPDAKKPAARKPAAKADAKKPAAKTTTKKPAASKTPAKTDAKTATKKPAARTAVKKSALKAAKPAAPKTAARTAPVAPRASKTPTPPVARPAKQVLPAARPKPAPVVRPAARPAARTTVTGPVNIGLYYFSTTIPALKSLNQNRAFYLEYYLKAFDDKGQVIASLGTATKPKRIKRTVDAPPPPRRRKEPTAVPLYKNGVFWAALIGGVVVVAGGATAAILLLNQKPAPTTGSAVITIARIK